MKEKIFNEKNYTTFIIISILIFPVLELIGIFFNRQFFMQEEALSLIGAFGIIFLIIYIAKCIKKKNIVLSDIFLVTSILFCIISIITSKSIKISLKGHPHYSETPLQVMGYFTLFLIGTNISEEVNKKKILKTLLVLGIIEAAVALLQNFRLWPVLSPFDPGWYKEDHWAFGFTQHCNYFAPIAIIFTALYATKYMCEDNKRKQILTYIGALFCCFSILFTYTRIGWVGILAILFAILVLVLSKYRTKKDILKRKIQKYTFLFVGFLACFLIVGIPSGQIKSDISKSYEEIAKDIQNSEIRNFGTGRGAIWRAGIDALKRYPLTGVGFDIYDYAFIVSDRGAGFFQSKGHNEYLHTAVTQGIPSGLNYLAFCVYCVIFADKKILKGDSEYGKSDVTKMLLIAVCAYFAQALFNSSVTNVAIYKWILMGLLITKSEQKQIINENTWKNIRNILLKKI